MRWHGRRWRRRIFDVFEKEEAVLEEEMGMSETGTPKEILNGRATEFEGVYPILRVGNVAAHLQCSKKLDWSPSAALRIGARDAGVRSCRSDRS